MRYILDYLQKHNVPQRFVTPWHASLPIIIVIPCYNEPNLNTSLQSLIACKGIDANVEVIVVVNSGEHDTPEVIQQNRNTYNALLKAYPFTEANKVNIYPLLLENIRRKHAGVGYARKIGMDTAVSTFYANQNANGIIVSLDADTLVQNNYLEALYGAYLKTTIGGGTIRFAHYTQDVNEKVSEAAEIYELHLRYYHNALKYSGFPFAFYTIGSAFYVRCSAYVKHGGMNRKQGGEDFYFLQKVLPKINYTTINSTCVFPSARESDRVPFGTGPQIIQYIKTGQIKTYALESFLHLKRFFNVQKYVYIMDATQMQASINKLDKSIVEFLMAFDAVKKIETIKANTNSEESFSKRFFDVFNAFFVVKYLNFVHEGAFNKVEVFPEASRFLKLLDKIPSVNLFDTLNEYREMDALND